jgi:hypothetical protein
MQRQSSIEAAREFGQVGFKDFVREGMRELKFIELQDQPPSGNSGERSRLPAEKEPAELSSITGWLGGAIKTSNDA